MRRRKKKEEEEGKMCSFNHTWNPVSLLRLTKILKKPFGLHVTKSGFL